MLQYDDFRIVYHLIWVFKCVSAPGGSVPFRLIPTRRIPIEFSTFRYATEPLRCAEGGEPSCRISNTTSWIHD